MNAKTILLAAVAGCLCLAVFFGINDSRAKSTTVDLASAPGKASTSPTPVSTSAPTATPVPTGKPADLRQLTINRGHWKQKNKRIYYYDGNKKKVTGFVKIKSKKYYFNKKGVQQTGWIKIKKKYYYFKIGKKTKGCMVKSKTVNKIYINKKGQAKPKKSWQKQKLKLMASCSKIANKVTNVTMTKMQRLRAMYNYELKHYRILGSPTFHLSTHWDLVYAKRIFNEGHGACYEWGAIYAYFANAVGAKKCYSVSSGGHGWAEVEGKCCDPNWERTNRHPSYFMIDYSLSGKGGRPNYKNCRVYLRRI